ncbi:MAG: HEPN domain-containing protein [Oscillospiraceae bacterium]|nr:HEPN domain-containing protein [Oscillospiraceae bacterium]
MGRGNHGTDSRRYWDWLFHSKLDHIAAGLLMEDERCYAAAAFHCQQCIEKALKAFLLYKNRRLLDGHNLTWLCKQAVLSEKTFMQWLGKSATLNRYYIETRYPADIPLAINRETIEDLFASTTQMLEFICEELHFDFDSYHRGKSQKG